MSYIARRTALAAPVVRTPQLGFMTTYGASGPDPIIDDATSIYQPAKALQKSAERMLSDVWKQYRTGIIAAGVVVGGLLLLGAIRGGRR